MTPFVANYILYSSVEADNWIPFVLKIASPKNLCLVSLISFVYESYYNECVRHLNVTIREHIGISPMTKKRVNSVVGNDLLFWDHYYTNNFSVLIRKNGKFSLEFKESLLITRDKPSLSRIISCAPLCLFDRI